MKVNKVLEVMSVIDERKTPSDMHEEYVYYSDSNEEFLHVGDMDMMTNQSQSINIMDLSSKSELYLLEVYSDATQYGGLSETNILHHEEEGYIRL